MPPMLRTPDAEKLTLRHISFRQLGTSDVHQRYLEDDLDVGAYLGKRPKNVAELLFKTKSAAPRAVPREALAIAFRAYAERHDAPSAVLANADSLTNPKVRLVITGQQPGLVGGPLFSLFKVATAIRLCREIEQADPEMRCVPVFWNHSDDHDLEEANRLFLVNGGQEIQRFRLDLERDGAPLRSVRCGDEVQKLLDEIDPLIPQSEYRKWALDLFRSRTPEETLGDSMARMMFALFGEHGLLIIEPRDLPMQAFATLESWWTKADSIRNVVRQSCDQLTDLGVDVTIDPSTTLMFDTIGKRRQALADNERFSSPENLSPGALLRPLWQDACLPTIGFVVGPGELSYLAVVAPLYRLLGAPQPAFIPRASLTLVEPSMQRILTKFGWDLADLEQGPEKLGAGIKSEAQGGVEDEIDDVATRLRDSLDQIGQRLVTVDASLLSAIDRARTKASDELGKLAQKLRVARQNREGTGLRQIRNLCACLRPRSRLQERVLGPLMFLVTHGPSLGATLVDAADPFSTEHGILEL